MSRIYFYLNVYEEIKQKKEADPDYFKNKANQVPIYLDYSFGQRIRTSTRLFVNPIDWDQSRQRIRATDPDAGPKNNRLTTIRGKLLNIETDAIRDSIRLTAHYIKSKLAPGTLIKGDSGSQKFFTDTWDKFVNLPDKSEGTRYNYENTLAVIRDFCTVNNRKLSLDEITQDFYQDLVTYFFTDRKLTRNTVGKYIKNIKAFMNYCNSKGLTANADYKKFEVYKEQQLISYLTIDELKTLKSVELKTETQQHVRDLFLFMCFTGLRYSDTQKITPGNIRHGYIMFTTVKTKTPQGTPIIAQAMEILEKYNCSLPKVSIKTYNDTIKDIGGRAGFTKETTKIRFIGADRVEIKKPMNEFFSSHLAKRTFISIFFRGGGHMETIMKTTGNKDRKTMKHYLAIENQDVKNEVNKVWENIDI
ncbi:MAG: site-specific integrase [Bacteroidota bacterium]